MILHYIDLIKQFFSRGRHKEEMSKVICLFTQISEEENENQSLGVVKPITLHMSKELK
jgi:hypothetical protein